MGDDGRSPALPALEDLTSADEGLYYLALHSFMDGFGAPRSRREAGRRLESLEETLHREGRLTAEARRLLGTLRAGQRLAGRVREGSAEVTGEDVAAMTHSFLQWCDLVGFDDAALDHIRRGLALWTGPADETTSREAARLRKAGSRMRRNPAEVAVELDRVVREGGRLSKAARDHLDYLARFSFYTRSRADYARSVRSLTPVQREVVARIRGEGNFALTGAPGTGKTVVLLHAFGAELEDADQELGLTEDQPVVLLTYTRTLVRFSEYLNGIMGHHRAAARIMTVDAYLLARLRELRDEAYIVYPGRAAAMFSRILEPLAATLRDAGFVEPDEDALWQEIDRLCAPAAPSRRQYRHADGGVLGLPVDSPLRDQVWDAAAAARAHMAESGAYSRSAALALIAREWAGTPAARRIFVDEAQDLDETTVAVLSQLTRRGLVLAGDDFQRIYRSAGSLHRAGVDVQGRSRVLRQNHRNTRAIEALARRYRAACSAGDGDRPAGVDGARKDDTGLRDGPEPEVVVTPDRAAAVDAVVGRVALCITELGYEPDQIAVLVPSNDDVADLVPAFQSAGIALRNVRSRGFDFGVSRGVRVSTMHSAKGVEYPVVVLFLPGFSERPGLDGEGREALERNLIYVSITRAMDYLHAVLVEPAGSPAIADLRACTAGEPPDGNHMKT